MKKFYITTAIPYVNDKPHIGHAMDFVFADVLARYHKQQGDDVIFCIGTDEHGAKIAEKAEAAGLSPKEFADSIVPAWKDFAKAAGLTNNRFIRTTDKSHEDRSAIIWKTLEKYIYKGTYIGWYCVGCEEYKTDTYVKDTNGTCPDHNRKYDQLQEQNYYFALSKFSEQLKTAITNKTLDIKPEFRAKEILSLIESGLEDISVSRPSQKIAWGIPVPGDPTQVMYVWFEALMNYITVLGYPEHKDFATYWPADVQVIGKDIIRFHAANLPAMLMGLNVELPKTLFVHGHVTSEGKKMSKTLGNVVDPIAVIEKFGLDPFRYYLTRHIPSFEDGDFSWDRFTTAYNSELANELGNAVQRIAAMINKYQDGVIGPMPGARHDVNSYHDAMAECRLDRAVEAVWEQVRGINQFIEEEKPWAIAKNGDAENLQEVLAEAAGSLMEIADLLIPFMPATAQKIHDVFADGIIKPLSDASLFPRYEPPTTP